MKLSEEYQYIILLEDILEFGHEQIDRTGVGTKSLNGAMMKFDMRNGFPLLTTKKMAWKSIVGELLWFLEGSQSDRRLAEITYGDGDHRTIWTDNYEAESWQNKLKEFRRLYGHKYVEGLIDKRDLGAIYGKMWRNSFDTDQLKNLIRSIKEDPNSRRHIVTAWNPSQLSLMALPPCHVLFQCHVQGEFLDLTMFQRSADCFLGVPYNIASYSLLLHILAAETNLIPRFFNHMLSDYHIYLNHIDQVKEQIKRIPYKFPILEFEKKPLFTEDGRISYSVYDFIIKDYNYHSSLKGKMAV